MTSFRSSPKDDELMHRLMLKLNVGSKTELIRLGLQKLDNDTLVVRAYVPPPPTLKQAIATVSKSIETWSLAVRNFYPVEIVGQDLERAAKVQHARELSDQALTEFTPTLRLIRTIAAACTAEIESKAFDEIRRTVGALQQYLERQRNVLRTAAPGSEETKAAAKNIREWTALVDFLVAIGFGTPRPVGTTMSSPDTSQV